MWRISDRDTQSFLNRPVENCLLNSRIHLFGKWGFCQQHNKLSFAPMPDLPGWSPSTLWRCRWPPGWAKSQDMNFTLISALFAGWMDARNGARRWHFPLRQLVSLPSSYSSWFEEGIKTVPDRTNMQDVCILGLLGSTATHRSYKNDHISHKFLI